MAFSQTLPALEVSGSGLRLARYSPLGISYSPVLSGSGAWTASLRSFSNNSTSTILSYGIGGTKNLAVNVSVSISKSRSLSNGGALPHAAPTSVNGSLSIGRDQSGTIVIWSTRGTEHTGLIWSISIHYIQSGAIQHGFITFLFSEETSAFRSNKGDDLVLPSQAAATNVGIAQQYDFEVANVLGPLLTIRDYAYSAGAVALIGVVAGIARNIDFSNARKFDECLGLNEGEFAVLAALSGVGARFSGAELLERNGIVRDWSTLSNLLEKFRRLGTMETGVAIRRGVPLVLWKSGVR